MKYWLIKSEPNTYSWEDLVAEKKTDWTGIRNYSARIHLRAMKKGDLVLFYYSMAKETGVIGVAEVTREAYQDPTDKGSTWICVDIKPVKKFAQFVPLKLIKTVSTLKNMVLLKNSRLSVQPVTTAEYNEIVKLER